jgi:basic membrane protein A and related proteins
MKQRPCSLRPAAVALGAFAALSVFGVGVLPTHAADQPVKAAFIYVDPVGDTGWSYEHDLARRELEHRWLRSAIKDGHVQSLLWS